MNLFKYSHSIHLVMNVKKECQKTTYSFQTTIFYLHVQVIYKTQYIFPKVT